MLKEKVFIKEKKKLRNTKVLKNEAKVKKTVKENIDKNSQKGKIFQFLSSGLAKASCHFIQNATPIIEKLCVQFQAQKTLIHIMRPIILDFFKELLSRFVKPDIIKKTVLYL